MATRKLVHSDCPNCLKLAAHIAQLEERLSKLEAELAKAKKHSGNSSKPPSGDIVNAGKGKKKPSPGQRQRGGQLGHTRHERTPFAADQIDDTWLHYYEGCPCCGGELVDTDAPLKVLQQVELKALPLVVAEHQPLCKFHCPSREARLGSRSSRLTVRRFGCHIRIYRLSN